MEDLPPEGDITIRTVAMPADLNPAGDVFGGWLMAQMDIAGGIAARRLAEGRVVTVAVDAMQFHRPMHVGDELSCYCSIHRVGRTSVAIRIQAWVVRLATPAFEKVTEGLFTYVAVDSDGRPRPLPASAE